MYEDEKLICEDCGSEFVFTAGEQEFYAARGLVNKPKRCPECRKKYREEIKKVLDGSSKESLESSKGVIFIRQNEEYEYNAKQIIELDKAHEKCSKKLLLFF